MADPVVNPTNPTATPPAPTAPPTPTPTTAPPAPMAPARRRRSATATPVPAATTPPTTVTPPTPAAVSVATNTAPVAPPATTPTIPGMMWVALLLVYLTLAIPLWSHLWRSPLEAGTQVATTTKEQGVILFSGDVTEAGITVGVPANTKPVVTAPPEQAGRLAVREVAGGLELKAAGTPVNVLVTGTPK